MAGADIVAVDDQQALAGSIAQAFDKAHGVPSPPIAAAGGAPKLQTRSARMAMRTSSDRLAAFILVMTLAR